MARLTRKTTVRPGRTRRRPGLSPRIRRIMLITGGIASMAVLVAWVWFSGLAARATAQAGEAMLAASAAAGFRLERVAVTGRRHTPADDLVAALAIGRGDPILDFDPAAARERIEALAWVRRAEIRRALPDSLHIRLVERHPFALWQHDGALAVIDAQGTALAPGDGADYRRLPLVVGADAPAHAARLIGDLGAAPNVRARTRAAIRVGARRWDLRLADGLRVRLPEQGVAAALSRLEALQAEHGLLDQAIETIDLRFDDRLIVKPAGAARLAQAEGVE